MEIQNQDYHHDDDCYDDDDDCHDDDDAHNWHKTLPRWYKGQDRAQPNLTFKLSEFTCWVRLEVRQAVSSFSSEEESCEENQLLPFFCPEDNEQD